MFMVENKFLEVEKNNFGAKIKKHFVVKFCRKVEIIAHIFIPDLIILKLEMVVLMLKHVVGWVEMLFMTENEYLEVEMVELWS